MNTETLADFIVDTGYGRIPNEAVANAKKCILDCLGVALVGSLEPLSTVMVNYVKGAAGKPQAGVISAGFKTSLADAALANGTLAHALDYDDASLKGIVHPSAVILPAVLALGEQRGLSGRQLLEAFIIGWEVGAKLGDQLSDKSMNLGWHATAVVGPLAAAAAAAKILRLSQTKTRIALGIAASQSGGLRVNFGTDTKPLHAGNAARSGLVAAILAEQGFTASESILDGILGLPSVLAKSELDAVELGKGLGSPFDIASPGPYLKAYPSCATGHRTIDAALELAQEHKLKVDEVAEVRCIISRKVSQILAFSRPRTASEAKFSLEYCVAAALVDGEVTLKQFRADKITAPSMQKLMERVRIEHPETEPAGLAVDLPQVVVIKLKDGREYSHQVGFPKGDPRNPLNWTEVVSKYRDCAAGVQAPDDIDLTIKLVSNMESLQDVKELAEAVTSAGRRLS